MEITENTSITNVQMVQNFLTQNYLFKYNANTNRLLVKDKKADDGFHYLNDFEFNTILKNIKIANIKCSKDLLRTVLFSDFVTKFDPFTAYLSDLPKWDGTDYVSKLADSVKTTDQGHWKYCLKKWLVAMVASLADEKVVNHTAIIFSGSQGIGKTRWFHTIIPAPLKEFVYEGYIQTRDKETNVKLSECILILMDELENMSDKNIDALKMLMTQESIYLRRAYQVMSQTYTRRASFAGTVNKKQFLTDLTGNRRFLCFEVESINLNHQVPLEQLYSQLLHLFKTGFQFWFDEKEIAKLNEKNAQFRFVSVEEEALLSHFEPCKYGEETSFLQTTQIQQALVQQTGYKSLSIQKLGRLLRDMKFERVKREGVYGYLVKEKVNKAE